MNLSGFPEFSKDRKLRAGWGSGDFEDCSCTLGTINRYLVRQGCTLDSLNSFKEYPVFSLRLLWMFKITWTLNFLMVRGKKHFLN